MLMAVFVLGLYAADLNSERCAWEITDPAQFSRFAWESETGEQYLLGIVPPDGLASMPGPIFMRPAVFEVDPQFGAFGHIEALRLCCPELVRGGLQGTDDFQIMWDPIADVYLLSMHPSWTLADVSRSYEKIGARFHPGNLFYRPLTRQQVDEAKSWPPGVVPVIFSAEERRYIRYALGVGYGRLRFVAAADWARVHEEGSLTRQDIVLLEEVPIDFDSRIAGAVTCVPQGPLSHVNLICLQESTPNAYIANAWEILSPFRDKLIRLEVGDGSYSVREVGEEEAALFWERRRPAPQAIAAPDGDFRDMPAVAAIAGTYEPERFGGKGGYLARFLPAIPEANRVPAFVIPFARLDDYLANNFWGDCSFAEAIWLMQQDEGFRTDSGVRKALLAEFQAQVQHGNVDANFVEEVSNRIREVFGSSSVMVRFRSSSNAEDALFFPGAGLYDSFSACVDDSYDEDGVGPSACDPAEPEERRVERALRHVWGSLWNFRAFEQRAWHGISEDAVRMGILVTPAFLDEGANGVALTGSPTDPRDRRYFVTAQLGGASVVRPEPGDVPETDVVAVAENGACTITRPQFSTLVPFGTFVMKDAELIELAGVLRSLDASYVPPAPVPKELTRLDVEFKLTPNRRVLIKQVRPYLVPGTVKLIERLVPKSYAFRSTRLLAVARGAADVVSELRARSLIDLVGPRVILPMDSDAAAVSWIGSVSYAGTPAPVVPPELARVTLSGDFQRWTTGVATYTWRLAQEASLPDGTPIELRSDPYRAGIEFWEAGDAPVSGTDLVFAFKDGVQVAKYVPLEGDAFPRYRIAIELVEDGAFDLLVRAPSAQTTSTDAILAGMKGSVRGRSFFVDDPFMCAVGEGPAPTRVAYLAVLGAEDMYALLVEFVTGQTDPSVTILDRELARKERLAVLRWSRGLFSLPQNPRFLRGDATGDGVINLADAVKVLELLFTTGGEAACPDAFDANDDGVLNISDAVTVLRHLFAGPRLSAACDFDATKDELPVCTYDLWACLRN